MAERRKPVWPANDGTYHESAKARDQHEAKAELRAWLIREATVVESGQDLVAIEETVDAIMEGISADPIGFRKLLIPALPPVKRGPKVPAKKSGAKIAAE